MYRQTEASECGLACIAMIAASHGAQVDLIALRRRFGLSLRGANLATILRIADTMGLACRSVKVPLGALGQLRTPAILHWDFNHFVVLERCVRGAAIIHDPAAGIRKYTVQELSDHFTGVAVELSATDLLQDAQNPGKTNFASILRRASGLGRTLTQVILLSIVLQIFLLLSPLYLQIVVDEVLPNFNIDLLTTLAIGFGLFTVLNALTDALRTFVLVHSGACLSFQFAADLFCHLTRLPLDYFEKRHVGDVLSRFNALGPINEALIQGVASTLIDGLMLLLTLALMLLYSPKISAIVITAFALYAALRLSLYHRLRRLSEHAIVTKAKEQSVSIETLRAMLPLKVFCKEPQQREKWQNLLANSISAEADLAKTQLWFSLANSLVFGLENIAVIFVGASEVLRSAFTVGMLFAFLTYKRQFVDKSIQVIEAIINFKMLGLHFERLDDIKSAKPEPTDDVLTSSRPFQGGVSLANIRYAYAADQSDVLTGINLTIPAGQRVALVGESGCGKTTLIKILLGLLPPTAGEVLADGVSLSQFGMLAYRRSIAAVMQEDQLFTGSIADNIALFDPNADIKAIGDCARQAAILDDITSMPMGFDTLIGDMGSTLSGGQKQRILLARALYARPALLVLDEGTAHLDSATEAVINSTLRDLQITIISVAHRDATILAADRVITIASGTVASDHCNAAPQ